MREFGFLLAAVLGACDASISEAQNEMTQVRGSLRLPFDNSTGFLNGYRLRVPAKGEMTWNGQTVDDARLRTYLSQYATPPESDPLFVEFEPGVPKSRANEVRQWIIDSGLCSQHRCVEVGWNVPRPVVH
jgi:hypothetical protein